MNENPKTLAMLFFTLMCGAPLFAAAQPAPAISTSPVVPTTTPMMPPVIGAPATRGGGMKEIDGLLSQLSAISSDLKKFIAGGAEAMPFDESEGAFVSRADRLKGLEKECGERFSAKDLSGVVFNNGVEPDVVAYQQCRAFVEKNPKACEALDQVKFKQPRSGPSLAVSCRESATRLLAAPSIISHSADAADRCMDWTTQIGMAAQYPVDSLRKVCALIVSRADAHAVAPQVAAILKMSPEETSETEKNIAEIKGESQACAKTANAERCQSFAAFRKAFAAKDPAACGKSWQCRLMLAHPVDCDSYGRLVSRGYCHDSSLAKIQEQLPLIEAQEAKWQKEQKEHPRMTRQAKYAQVFQQKRAQADALTALLMQNIDHHEPKNTQEYRRRKTRFNALREELQQTMHEFVSDTAPKAAPKRKKTSDQ